VSSSNAWKTNSLSKWLRSKGAMSSIAVKQDAGSAAIQTEARDQYRILVLRKDGSELLAGDRPPLTLPRVDIPKCERVAENLAIEFTRLYGISAISLFAPDFPAEGIAEPPRYHVMETRDASCRPPADYHWLAPDSFSDQSLADPHDRVATAAAFRQIRDFESEKTHGPFGKPAWIEELFSWVGPAIEAYGLHLTGKFRQLNASPTFALLRLETNGTAVWFKAVGEPNLHEFPISVALSRLFPGFVPNIIATRAAWNGWLATEFVGSPPDRTQGAGVWERVAETFAQLQIASLDKVDLLLEAGIRDLRAQRLLEVVEPFMEAMADQMSLQTNASPPALSPLQLRTLGTEIRDALCKWVELNIPDTLGHSDFNPDNILCSGEQCMFLDWAEAYIGSPFMTLEYLREYLGRLKPNSLLVKANTLFGHSKAWDSVLPTAVYAKAQVLTPLLSVFAYAVVSGHWQDPVLLRQSGRAAYLRSLTRRMLREAQALH
jgi:hypothetical protein